MYLKQLKLGNMENFTYLMANPLERLGTVIDPGWGGRWVDHLLAEASKDGITIKYIVATHCHSDHIGGAAELIERTGAELLVHAEELESMTRLAFTPDMVVKDNDLVNLGGLPVRVLHTPGHTPGSISLLTHRRLFTGDTLFVRGCGRADLPRSDPEALYRSLYEKISKLPDNTEICPGHDYGPTPISTLGREKAENPYLRCDSLEAFLHLRMG